MNPVILDGKKVAGKVEAEVIERVQALGRKPLLAIITSGVDEASKVYVRNKVAAAKRCGINTMVVSLREDMTTEEYAQAVDRIDSWHDVDGVIVQLPLPEHVDVEEVLDWIRPYKDVDGLTDDCAYVRGTDDEIFVPCTPAGIMRLLDEYEIQIEGKHAVVIGRSELVGKPIAQMLLNRNATVTVCHSKTEDLASITRTADILICAAGVPNLIHGGMLKVGSTVIDVGINHVPERDSYGVATGKMVLCGDVDLKSSLTAVDHITPVPGGVGPMTVAMLMNNVVRAAEMKDERHRR